MEATVQTSARVSDRFPKSSRLGILTKVLSAAARAEGLPDALIVTLRVLTQHFNVAASSLLLVEEVGREQRLVLRAAEGPQATDCNTAYHSLGEGLTGEIATGKTLTFRTLKERHAHPKYLGKYDHEKDISAAHQTHSAFLGVPLCLGSEVTGVLKLEYLQPTPEHPEDFFTDADIHAVEAVGLVLAYVVVNNRHRQDTLTEFDLFAGSELLIESRTSEEDVIADALRYLKNSRLGEALVSMYNPSTGMIEGKFASCERLRRILPITRRDIQGPDILAEVLRTRREVFVDDSAADPRCDSLAVSESGVITQFVLPLVFGSELIGTLQVDTTPRSHLGKEERLILKALAASVSMAISHIRSTSRLLDLSNQVMTSSRFLVAETLAGITVHSIKHRLGEILKELDKDLERRDYRDRRELLERLQHWKKQLEPLFIDTQKSLEIVRAQAEGDGEYFTVVVEQMQPAIDLWISLLQHKGVHVKTVVAKGTRSRCRIGAPQFRELMSVLIVNSVQAFCKNILITVESLEDAVESPINNFIDNPLQILVEDDGTGLPTEDHELLFSPTYSTKHERFGTGLGLFIGRGLVQRAGGNLIVHSRQPKKGACFSILLPTF